MSRSMFGMGFTLLNLFVGIPSVLVGASIVHWGIRKTFGIGSALILVGALWLSLITYRPWHYWVGFGVLAATGAALATHEHRWGDTTLQVKLGLVVLVAILIGAHMRRPELHVLDGAIFAVSLAIVWLGVAVAH